MGGPWGNYAKLSSSTGASNKQRVSAKISQRGNLVILFFVVAHMLTGMLSEYEQNLALYGVFSILNGLTGVLVFLFHSSASEAVTTEPPPCPLTISLGVQPTTQPQSDQL